MLPAWSPAKSARLMCRPGPRSSGNCQQGNLNRGSKLFGSEEVGSTCVREVPRRGRPASIVPNLRAHPNHSSSTRKKSTQQVIPTLESLQKSTAPACMKLNKRSTTM
eukprot:scaffold59262_cov19-Prasinocladus_malaysianus.AAC.1